MQWAYLPFYAAVLTRFNPAYLSGYPSSMYVLAQYYLHSGEKPPRPAAALTSAETVLDHQRAVIEEAFQTRVFDQYGQTEMQSFWYECSHNRMHAHPLAGITEILDEDGAPSRHEHAGDVVLTGFLNLAMPLIRYQVGDRAVITSRRCPCGRQMQGIARIEGRQEDYVYTRERGFVGRLDPAFKGVNGIVESQIVQLSIDVVEVRYVAGSGFSGSELIKLESNLRARLGGQVRLGFVAVEAIPRTANGKFRAVISHVPFLKRGEVRAGAGTPIGIL
jgi:phenylacetate-CoA ligase